MTTANIDPALERNRAFAAAGGHQGAVVFPNLRLFVITCLDPLGVLAAEGVVGERAGTALGVVDHGDLEQWAA